MNTYRLRHPGRLALALLGILAVGSTGIATADTEDNMRLQQHERRMNRDAKWNALTPEQQDAAAARAKGAYQSRSAKAKESWSNLSEEEQDAAKAQFRDNSKARRAQARAAQEDLTQEQRDHLREENKALYQERRARRQESD
jgi:uncharacterized iron-regulated membrane protein